MIAHWPAGIAGRGQVRSQWHHCIDVAPTILQAAGIPEPDMVDGTRQSPIEGTSFAYTFDDAEAPSRHGTQYFEIHGSRGIYHDGWTAVTLHVPMPWSRSRSQPAFIDDVWELYDNDSDWTQADDVAEHYPEKLAKLKERFLAEAARYQVLPLDDRMRERFDPADAPRPDLLGGRRSIVLRPGMRGLREGAAPNVKNGSFGVLAEIDVPEGGADGVLVAQGGRFAGWSLYVKDGRPVYCHNRCGDRMYTRATEPMGQGRHEVELLFDYDGGGIGKGGTATLVVDGCTVASGRLEATVGFQFSMDETMDIGCDRGTPVTEEYAAGPAANAYAGRVGLVYVRLGERSEQPSAEDMRRVVMTTH